jgi:hypothetical protein
MTKEERKAVADYIISHPEHTYSAISRITGLAYSTITRIAGEFEITRPTGKRTAPSFTANKNEAR